MPLPKEKKYTANEFFSITPESNSERYELIDGEITALAAPNTLHQRIVGRVHSDILRFIESKKGKCEPFVAPFDVKIDDWNIVQPDVLVVCDPNKIDDKRCNGAPDMVVEITSSNHKRDYVDKMALYRNSGVREYWIIDTQNNRSLVYFWDKGECPNIYTFEQDIPVGIFDNELKINISKLL